MFEILNEHERMSLDAFWARHTNGFDVVRTCISIVYNGLYETTQVWLGCTYVKKHSLACIVLKQSAHKRYLGDSRNTCIPFSV